MTEPRTATRSRPAPRGATSWTSAAISLVLLLALSFFFGPQPSDDAFASEYHAHARVEASRLPLTVADWVGQDVEVPPSAVELLHPNVLVSRRFENVRTGEIADLLLVQCSDSRDLQGHYPPVCYPSHGMTPGTILAKSWTLEGLSIDGMRYTFHRDDPTASTHIVVDNFMVLPTGEFGADMTSVYRVGKNRHLRRFGAAQVQLLTSDAMSDERRDEVLGELVLPLVPLLTILNAEAPRE